MILLRREEAAQGLNAEDRVLSFFRKAYAVLMLLLAYGTRGTFIDLGLFVVFRLIVKGENFSYGSVL